MGGSSGGGASAPYEAPNTLSSAQALRIIDAISEGVVSGFANGDDAPFKSVFFDDTPVQNKDGSFNFKGVVGYFQRGTPDQSYIPGFDTSERTVSVSAKVRKDAPVVRAVTDELVSTLRVTVGVERNVQVKDNGDSVAAQTHLVVELVNSAGVQAAKTVLFDEKGSGAYYQDVVFGDLPAVPFNIRVVRVSPDSTTDRLSNNTFFSSYVEGIDARLSYPHTAVAALAIDSDQFGNSVPRRNYLLKGRLVKVPSNYNPETRVYDGEFWDGSFKTAWTNNPAWVFYDVLTQPRFSTLARRLNLADVDKWALYQVARWCDEPVDDGFGGKEPRFVCNAYISSQRQAAELLQDLCSVFTGLPVWNGGQVSVVVDSDSDPVAQYTNANVKDGLFTYAGASYKSITTAVLVQYIDKYDGYRTKTEYVEDREAVKRYGLNQKQVTAFGCDSRGQAARFGAWILQTELRQQHTVSFSVGREGLMHLPYDVVRVADNDYAGTMLGGRVVSVRGSRVVVDTADIPLTRGELMISVADGNGGSTMRPFTFTNRAGAELTVSGIVGVAHGIEPGAVWTYKGAVAPRLYRAVSIKENQEEGSYTVTALLHDPRKYAAVDGWAKFERELATLHTMSPVVSDAAATATASGMLLTWSAQTAGGESLSYDIKVYRDGKLYRHVPDAATAELLLENLPHGSYRAEIRGRNARGVLSDPLIKEWVVDYNVSDLRATPQLFAVRLNWINPQNAPAPLSVEVWVSETDLLADARRQAVLPLPTNEYIVQGVDLGKPLYFWVRVADSRGWTGEFVGGVRGEASHDAGQIVEHLTGKIGATQLAKDVHDLMMSAVQPEALEEARAALEEQSEAAAAVAEAALQQAQEVGTALTRTDKKTDTTAKALQQLTAAHGQTAAALQAEQKARADGDKAESAARQTLATQVSQNTGRIIEVAQSVSDLEGTVNRKHEELQGEVRGISVGARNLLIDSEFSRPQNWSAAVGIVATVRDGRRLLHVSRKSEGGGACGVVQADGGSLSRIKQGETYTLSLNAQGTAGFRATGLNYVHLMRPSTEGINYRLETMPLTASLSNRPSITFVAPWSSDSMRLLVGALGTFAADDWFEFHSVKLERGSVATDWTPAPEDVDGNIAAVKTYAETQVGLLDSRATKLEQLSASFKALNLFDLDTAESGKYVQETTGNILAGSGHRVSGFIPVRPESDYLWSVIGGDSFNMRVAFYNNAKTYISGRLQSGAATSMNISTKGIANAAFMRVSGSFQTASGYAWEIKPDTRGAEFDAKIETLRQTVAEADGARAQEISTLSASLQNVGGRNLLKGSDVLHQSAAYSRRYELVSAPAVGETITVTLWGELGAGRTGIGVYNSHGYTQLANLVKVADGVYRGTGRWAKPMRDGAEVAPNDTHLNVYFYPSSATSVNTINRIKLERGSIATDWTPAAEDLQGQITETKQSFANLNGTVSSMWTLKTEAISGGRRVIGGLSVGANSNGDAGMLVYANSFALVNPTSERWDTPFAVTTDVTGRAKVALKGDFIATGSILGQHIRANQTISAPNVVGGSLNIGNGKFTVNNDGSVSIKADSARKVGMVITNDRIEVYDESGVLRVRLGRLS